MDNIYYRKRTQKEIIKEIKKVEKIIAPTFGPQGSSVIIQNEKMIPIITDDGYVITQNLIKYSAPLYHAIEKMDDKVGDGTTTCALLTSKLIKETYRNEKIFKINDYKKGLQDAYEKTIKYLEKEKKMPTPFDLMNIATISSKDSSIGYLIGNIYAENGLDSFIKITEAASKETTYKFEKGFTIKKAVLPKTIENGKVELENVKVHLFPQGLENLNNINQGLVITSTINKFLLDEIIEKNKKEKSKIYILKIPITSVYDEFIYEDLKSYLGKYTVACKIIMTCNETVIYNEGDASLSKVNYLQEMLEKNCNNNDIIEERIARLKNKVATIYIGGSTEVEIRTKRLKIIDAINACKNSIKEGIVSGGGLALFEASNVLEIDLKHKSKSYISGVNTFKDLLKHPYKTIIKNSNVSSKQILKEKKKQSKNIGFDVASKSFVNYYDKGIVDPCLNLKEAITIALSTTFSVFPVHAMIKKKINYQEIENMINK